MLDIIFGFSDDEWGVSKVLSINYNYSENFWKS